MAGSIPEIEESSDSIFNSATAYDPTGMSCSPCPVSATQAAYMGKTWACGSRIAATSAFTHAILTRTGKLVAKHRKVHLFDIDIPGRQTFKVSSYHSSAFDSSTEVSLFYARLVSNMTMLMQTGIRLPDGRIASDHIRCALRQDRTGNLL